MCWIVEGNAIVVDRFRCILIGSLKNVREITRGFNAA
jgi:hypothetical protein